MVALIVRPAKSEGGGKIWGARVRLGETFSLGHFLRACLLIMYFRCLAFCTDLPRWQCGTMRGEEKYAAGSTKDAFNYFICPAFFIFISFLFNIQVSCLMLLVCLISEACFKLDSFGKQCGYNQNQLL